MITYAFIASDADGNEAVSLDEALAFAAADGEVSDEDLYIIGVIWDAIDIDRSGVIRRKEFERWADHWVHGIVDWEAEFVKFLAAGFELADFNDDDTVTFSEAVDLAFADGEFSDDDSYFLHWIFSEIDKNHNGEITYGEFKHWARVFLYGPNKDERKDIVKKIRSAFESADFNSDDEVDAEEAW